MHESIAIISRRIIGRSFLIFVGLIILSGCSYEVPTPKHWSDGITVRKTMITEAQTVEDWNALSTLFTYYESPTAQPLIVQAVEGNRWIAVFEKPSWKLENSTVKIERVGENEYRLLITPGALFE